MKSIDALIRRDFEASSQVVRWLWDILEAMTEEDRVQFLIFVSGRSREMLFSNSIAFTDSVVRVFSHNPPCAVENSQSTTLSCYAFFEYLS